VKPFAERSKRAQVESLRKAALAAAAEFGLEGTQRLVFHGFNTTFRFSTPEGDFAMRINVNSRRTEGEIRGEIEFIRALQERTDLILPTPRCARSGQHVQSVAHPDFPRPLPVVVYSWLDGKHLHEGATGEDLFEVGQLMRKLHEGADGLTFPSGSERHQLVNFMDGIPIRTPDRAPFSAAVDLANAAFERIIAHGRFDTLLTAESPLPA
jgi:Ser/Thr protein kinase RdoA (MazF antagonist)